MRANRFPPIVQLTRADRSSEQALENIQLPGADGAMVPLRELVTVEHDTIQRSIYHKNLRRWSTSPAMWRAPRKARSTPS